MCTLYKWTVIVIVIVIIIISFLLVFQCIHQIFVTAYVCSKFDLTPAQIPVFLTGNHSKMNDVVQPNSV